MSSYRLLEDGSRRLLEDGSGFRILESSSGAVITGPPYPVLGFSRQPGATTTFTRQPGGPLAVLDEPVVELES